MSRLSAGLAGQGVPIGEAAAHLGLNVDAVRKRIKRGTLTAYKLDERWYVILDGVLPTVQDTPSSPPGSPIQHAVQPERDPIEAPYRVLPNEIEQAVARTSAQYMGDMRAMFAEVGKVYEAQLAAKDETLAELRRRAEAAEAERDALRAAQAAPPAPSEAEPARVAVDIPEVSAGLWGRLARWWRGAG